VAVLPIGATEPHGPHLPLDTDVTIALAQSRRACERWRARRQTAAAAAVAYGSRTSPTGFAGASDLRPGTLWALLEDVVESLEEQGVRRIVFSNAHLEPATWRPARRRGRRRPSAGQGPGALPRQHAPALGRDLGDGVPERRLPRRALRVELVLAADRRAVRASAMAGSRPSPST
jgi:hypothetical protein